jgi:hypothetical protein
MDAIIRATNERRTASSHTFIARFLLLFLMPFERCLPDTPR